MKKVYKYEFPVGAFVLALPAGFEILSVQTQFNKPCMWVLVDPNAPKHDVFFEVFGTGHEIHERRGTSMKYTGTFQMEGGAYVFHVFRCAESIEIWP